MKQGENPLQLHTCRPIMIILNMLYINTEIEIMKVHEQTVFVAYGDK